MRSREDDFSPGGTRKIVHKLEIVVFRTATFSQGWQKEKEDELSHDQKRRERFEFRLFGVCQSVIVVVGSGCWFVILDFVSFGKPGSFD